MRRFVAALLAAVGLTAFTGSRGAELKPGDPAPPFRLHGSDGKVHDLAELHGKAVVLAWFPKAFSGG